MADDVLTDRPDIQSVLTSRGLLAGAALERVRRLQAESGERAELIAAKLGLISDRDLAAAYADFLVPRTACSLPTSSARGWCRWPKPTRP